MTLNELIEYCDKTGISHNVNLGLYVSQADSYCPVLDTPYEAVDPETGDSFLVVAECDF